MNEIFKQKKVAVVRCPSDRPFKRNVGLSEPSAASVTSWASRAVKVRFEILSVVRCCLPAIPVFSLGGKGVYHTAAFKKKKKISLILSTLDL